MKTRWILSGRRRGWLRVALTWLALATAVSATAAESRYAEGYVQALLDSQFPGFGLRVQSVTPTRVALGARTCLGPWQKRDVERVLNEHRHALAVEWVPDKTCNDSTSASADDIEFEALPARELFAPLIADPRQSRFSVSFQHYDTPIDTFAAASAVVGEYFGLASGFLGKSGASQVGIQAAVFALFNTDAPSMDLVNADYWLGFPLSYRKGPWSYLLTLYHQSSHLGDEFILGNPGFDRVNLSYEELDFMASYEWDSLRVYGGNGYILHSEPDLKRWRVHAGAEYVQMRALGEFDLIVASDWQSSEELDWQWSLSHQVGFEFRHASKRRARLMLEYFHGHSPNGQFYQSRLRYSGIGLYLGF